MYITYYKSHSCEFQIYPFLKINRLLTLRSWTVQLLEVEQTEEEEGSRLDRGKGDELWLSVSIRLLEGPVRARPFSGPGSGEPRGCAPPSQPYVFVSINHVEAVRVDPKAREVKNSFHEGNLKEKR